FHIHEKGVCDPPDFESAGEHFNPTNAKHGFDHPKGPHAGDLPNLKVEKDGTAKATYVAEMVTLEKDKKNSLIGDDGTSLVIHADADDYKRSEEHTSELQSRFDLVCRLLLEKKKNHT